MRVGIDIRLLHHVFRLAIVAQDGPGGPVQPLVVPPHQHLEQGRLAVQHLRDDLLIREAAPPLQNCAADDVHGVPSIQ
jgi:hypothetical protein